MAERHSKGDSVVKDGILAGSLSASWDCPQTQPEGHRGRHDSESHETGRDGETIPVNPLRTGSFDLALPWGY